MAVLLLLVLGMSLFKPSLVGFVSAKTERQTLNLVIDSPQTYTLRSNQTLQIISLGISGSVIGDGSIGIWLGVENESLLIWSNTMLAENISNRITGMFSLEIEPNTTGEVSGAFVNECTETCTLPERFQRQEAYDLIFQVQPGTTLQLDEITYVIVE